jgi:hypothetical protein
MTRWMVERPRLYWWPGRRGISRPRRSGDPGFLADASELLGYELEEPPVLVTCPRCDRTLEEDERDRMVASAVADDVMICHDCEIAEERIELRGGTPQPRESWPVDPGMHAGIKQ